MAKVSLRAYNHEIETMIDRGYLDEAVAHCRHILKTFPKHLGTYRLLGKAYLEAKRYPEAEDIFSRILVAVPSDFVANVGMSIIRDEENKLDDAIWHMERAFETQPSNAAIQSELQRLYARRDGVAPPRIRMTRGALAHMYVQGELYPQAISEIKSVLKEDPGRNDMQVLLARAYFRSGLKNDAADIASTVLRTNPYNLDANRILAEILSVDHPESVQPYRQRVIELDPYASQVTSSMFLSNEAPDGAVTVERLDWNGQPVGVQPDWESRQAISLESGQQQNEQPDWLRNTFGETAPSVAQPTSLSPFDAAPPSAKPTGAEDNIPDFLREAGWGKSTGAFDESKSGFADTERESAAPEQSIEQGELPDWVKAMAPPQPTETPAEEEEMPDWINKIGTSSLPTPSPEEHRDYSESGDQTDWMNQLGQTPPPPAEKQPDRIDQLGETQPTSASSSAEQPDWLKQLDSTEEPATPAAEEQPDWLKGFANEAETPSAASSSDDLDWLNQLTAQPSSQSTEAASDEFDFLKDLGSQPQAAEAAPSNDEFDFLNPLGNPPKATPVGTPSEEFDFLNEFAAESEQVTPAAAMPEQPKADKAEPLGMSESEQDDAFAWLENLAAKQGATEGLLTKPEDRLQEEPDWVKQAKAEETNQPTMEQPAAVQPAESMEELGKSEQERDDSFAWLESLAAKQGATEGLLTKPEDRLEEEPEWVRQAKSLREQPQEQAPSTQVPADEQPTIMEPAASVEELGKSEQERDDSFAWLESLAAKHGATEGLLTKPEERPAEEPEWVKQAKDIEAQQPPVTTSEPEQPSIDETKVWLHGLGEESLAPPTEAGAAEVPDWLKQAEDIQAQQAPTAEPVAEEPISMDATAAWLRGLDEEVKPEERPQEEPEWLKPAKDVEAEGLSPAAPVSEPDAAGPDTETWLRSLEAEEAAPAMASSSADDTAMWLKSLDEAEEVLQQPAETPQADNLPAWMQNIEAKEPTESALPAERPTEQSDWISALEEEKPAPPETPKIETGGLPSWLRGLDEEEKRESAFASQEDLPAWLRNETGENLAEPTKIEPTHATDWQPVEARQPQPEPEARIPEPEPVAPPPQPEPEAMNVVDILEEKIAAVQEPEKPAPPPKRSKEPVRKVTGGLGDPVLGQARNELSRSNVSGALESYGRLIKKGRLLEDIIYDLREASYSYPVDVDIWQSLGDAYMRANRLQDALDAYTKAEELLR